MADVGFTQFRANLANHFDEVIRSRSPLLVTRQGSESAVVMAASEWERVQETLHLLGSRNNAGKLFGAIAELDAGRGVENDPTTDIEDGA
ncbi:type II toxin-antitoxin system Phd/YefM family antitoxin [Jiella mangrovi]|uniref:Antitoxin n=1 Tax=Jiella mangrovi TaxID=2821407 RepID=A0ABS4BMC7_9HYPH|nr:type II toxin-antitoxin system prevent-host-death family antitoxin [Jiella mangrovi]MBP0617315.1 type II toxin-antitoxin system prevent-host-death family antitoxin [Jiella mangrovi]